MTTGESPSEDAARELAAAAGLVRRPDQAGAPARVIKPEYEDQIGRDFGAALASIRLPALATIAATAPLAELERARDDLDAFLRLTEQLAETMRLRIATTARDPATLALVVPALIVLRRLVGEPTYTTLFTWARGNQPKPRNELGRPPPPRPDRPTRRRYHRNSRRDTKTG